MASGKDTDSQQPRTKRKQYSRATLIESRRIKASLLKSRQNIYFFLCWNKTPNNKTEYKYQQAKPRL